MEKQNEINHIAELEAIIEFVPSVQSVLLDMVKPFRYVNICNPKISYTSDELDTCITFALQNFYTPQSMVLFFVLWNKLCMEIDNLCCETGYTTLCDMEFETHRTETSEKEIKVDYLVRLTLPLVAVKKIIPLDI